MLFMLQGLLCCFTLGNLQHNAWVGRSLIMKDSVRIDNRFVRDGILGQRYECESTKAWKGGGFHTVITKPAIIASVITALCPVLMTVMSRCRLTYELHSSSLRPCKGYLMMCLLTITLNNGHVEAVPVRLSCICLKTPWLPGPAYDWFPGQHEGLPQS